MTTRTTKSPDGTWAPIVHGNTQYSQTMYMLFVENQPIRLTSTEIKLLTILLPRVGQIVRKPLILDKIYGHRPAVPQDTAINVAMCRLRRKLTDAGSDLVLRTIRGKGIMLESRA